MFMAKYSSSTLAFQSVSLSLSSASAMRSVRRRFTDKCCAMQAAGATLCLPKTNTATTRSKSRAVKYKLRRLLWSLRRTCCSLSISALMTRRCSCHYKLVAERKQHTYYEGASEAETQHTHSGSSTSAALGNRKRCNTTGEPQGESLPPHLAHNNYGRQFLKLNGCVRAQVYLTPCEDRLTPIRT